MKIITPSFEIIEQKPGLQGIYEQIEMAGRTCYASSHVIERDENGNSLTAEKFTKRMIDSTHLAMCEHGTVYLKIPKGTYAYGHYVTVCEPDDDFFSSSYELAYREYTKVNIQEDYIYVTTNLRVLQEHNWLKDLQYLCEPTEYHEKRITVLFTTDRITGESFLRHRTISEDHPDLEKSIKDLDEELNSFARQSTRYCNYSKDKFSNNITITSNSDISKEEAENALEMWTDVDNFSAFYNMCNHIAHFEGEEQFEIIDFWLFANLTCEWSYMNLLKRGWKPEQARRVLPFSINSPLVMTAFISNWEHFLRLRCSFIAETGKPHVDASLIADPLYKEIKKYD